MIDADLQPVDLCLPLMKEHTAKWLVEAANHISNNPQIIVNGFIKAGISKALDGIKKANPKISLIMIVKVCLVVRSSDNNEDDVATYPSATDQSDTDSDIIILDHPCLCNY